MKIELLMCDVCQAEVDGSTICLLTGEGDVGVIDKYERIDFCSADCLRSWVNALPGGSALSYDQGWRDACDDHLEQKRNPDHPFGTRKRTR